MQHLLIFDDSIEIKEWKLNSKVQAKISLFPLTSKASVIDEVRTYFEDLNWECELLPSGRIVNQVAEDIREDYIKFVAQLPDRIAKKGIQLKQNWRIDPGVSMWYLSLVAEKNTFKTDTFNLLAQFEAIVRVVDQENIGSIYFSCSSNKLKETLKTFTQDSLIGFEVLPVLTPENIKKLLGQWQSAPFIKHGILLMQFFVYFFFRIWWVKLKLWGELKSEIKHPFLAVTAFPYFDSAKAEEGVFKNNFYGGLQHSLEEKYLNFCWLAIFVENSKYSLSESLDNAIRFIRNGARILFIEQFISVGMQLQAFFVMVQSGIRFSKSEQLISKAHVFNNHEVFPLFRDDWYTSFVGKVGYYNVLNYFLFRKVFEKTEPVRALYFCENQGWEKAFLLANAESYRPIPVVAYQHATVSKMLLNYFNDHTEFDETKSVRMPLPQKIVCNGSIPLDYMKRSGWPEDRIVMAEAVRYNHLDVLLGKINERRDGILLVTSIDVNESALLLNIFIEAFRDFWSNKIKVRVHPFINVNELLKRMSIDQSMLDFEWSTEPLEKVLPSTKVVVAGQSGITLEAIASGCHIITVNYPEHINMSPVKDMDSSLITVVNSADELRRVSRELLREEEDTQRVAQEAHRIIDAYFYRNAGSKNPEKLLEVLRS